MTDRVALSEGAGAWGLEAGGPWVEYVAEVARPVVWASDGVWLTGHPRMLTHTNTRIHECRRPEAETGSGWRVVVVGALLVGGLWGVAVAWTLLALVRAM